MFFKRFIQKKKPKIKHQLRIGQQQVDILIEGKLTRTFYKVKQLWIKERNNDQIIKVDNKLKKNLYCFKLSMNEYGFNIPEEGTIYDFYLNIEVEEKFITEKQQNRLKKRAEIYINEHQQTIYEYRIRLGRFFETYVNDIEQHHFNNKSFLLYRTLKGNVSLAINKQINHKLITQVDHLSV